MNGCPCCRQLQKSASRAVRPCRKVSHSGGILSATLHNVRVPRNFLQVPPFREGSLTGALRNQLNLWLFSIPFSSNKNKSWLLPLLHNNPSAPVESVISTHDILLVKFFTWHFSVMPSWSIKRPFLPNCSFVGAGQLWSTFSDASRFEQPSISSKQNSNSEMTEFFFI